MTGQYASWHTENPASPYYTTDGQLEGSRSNLVRHASQTATSAIDYWLGAPFHAIGMLRAGLSSTAFAQDGLWAGMDVISGLSSGVRSATPILFPGPGRPSYLTKYSGGREPRPDGDLPEGQAGRRPGGKARVDAIPAGMLPCGYVVRLDAYDRTIVSAGGGWHDYAAVGFCLKHPA